MKIPRRQSLLLQTTEILRTAIGDGTWDLHLPGERELSRRLHISRPTLRAALEMLEREKVIQSAPGKRRKILKKLEAVIRSKPLSVVLISKVPLYAMSRNRLFLFDHLHRVLQENNILFEVVSNEAFGSDRPRAALKQLEKQIDSRVYLLALTSQEVQKWFSARGLPCLILGSSFPDVAIPSIECDYPATGRHAAGTLLGRGHRNLALIVPTTHLGGDVESESAFQQEVARSGHLTTCHIIRHGNDPHDLTRQWDRLQKSDHPPTAAFALYPPAATALLTHLLSKGIRVPEDFSILCRDGAPLFEWMHPPVAHYVLPLQHFAAKFSSLVLELATVGRLRLRNTPIMPELKLGESLARHSRNGC